MMKDTGERNESALLRKLVDEALDARRKKSRSAPLTEESDNAGVRLETIENLLMRLVGQADTSLRSVSEDREIAHQIFDCGLDLV